MGSLELVVLERARVAPWLAISGALHGAHNSNNNSGSSSSNSNSEAELISPLRLLACRPLAS